MIDRWLGYNHNLKIENGEFYDMDNLTTDAFPLLKPRDIRVRLKESLNGQIRGILCTDGNITYIDGDTLHYGSDEWDISDLLTDNSDWEQMIRFGAYIVMFPSNSYINVYDPTDRGHINQSYVTDVDKDITYTMCTADGSDYDNLVVSDEAPPNPTKNMYWAKTLKNAEGLYMWTGTEWMPVAASYVRIDIEDATLSDYFSEGDVVFMNGYLTDFNEGSEIVGMNNTSIVIMGMMDSKSKTYTTTSDWKFKLERKMPHLDYVCADKNRLWGCHYGYEEGVMINEIYCSKLGDFKNWYSFQGIASDSYSATVGIPEEWTGCISYQGYPTFFKENAIYRVFGSVPSNFQINQINARGVQSGSSKSLAIVDEMLVYKSAVDICVFDGSRPTSISEQLGRDRYYAAIGSGCLGKYRVEMETNLGKKALFVYDFKTGLWSKEEALKVKEFSSTENGQLYAANKTDVVGLGSKDNIAYLNPLVSEEYVKWSATTGDMGYEYPDYKYVARLTMRAKLPAKSEIKMSISYDDGIWNEVGTLRGRAGVESQSLAIHPLRCDHYKLMFEGHGDCIIYSLAISLDTESEEDGY